MTARAEKHLKKAEELEAKAKEAARDSSKRVFSELARTHRQLASYLLQADSEAANGPNGDAQRDVLRSAPYLALFDRM
jgi:hypothetical protein